MTLTNLAIQRAYHEQPLLPQVSAREGHPVYPRHALGVPPGQHRSGPYLARFAQNLDDLRAAQRLRLQVFDLELRAGPMEPFAMGLDSDAFDARCHHLLVIEHATDQVVGTYRLMSAELGSKGELCTATEFDLTGLPDHVFERGAEVGRACVHKDHRNGRVLQLLWRGIARYLDWNDKRYVFGCCSVPTLEGSEIAGVTAALARGGHVHPRHIAPVRPNLKLTHADTLMARPEMTLPPLFHSYLRLGAKVCGGPAVDRAFGVTDYLVLLDLRDMEPRMLASLAAPGLWQSVV